MAAPGGGEGNQASARATLKSASPVLYKILSAFPVGSEDWENMLEIVKRVGKIVGKAPENTTMSAIQQLAMAHKQGGPLKGAPPVGIQAAKPNIEPEKEPEPI